MLKCLFPLLSYKKNKNTQAFYTDLQKVKAELMATTQTSIFADEERLREKISKLYGSFCGMESKPNTTQLESINDLVMDFGKQKTDFGKVVVKHLPKNPEIKNPKNIK